MENKFNILRLKLSTEIESVLETRSLEADKHNVFFLEEEKHIVFWRGACILAPWNGRWRKSARIRIVNCGLGVLDILTFSLQSAEWKIIFNFDFCQTFRLFSLKEMIQKFSLLDKVCYVQNWWHHDIHWRKGCHSAPCVYCSLASCVLAGPVTCSCSCMQTSLPASLQSCWGPKKKQRWTDTTRVSGGRRGKMWLLCRFVLVYTQCTTMTFSDGIILYIACLNAKLK